ncbi:MAG: hypothetical protein ACRDQ2_17380 [Gaiellales bacterium]
MPGTVLSPRPLPDRRLPVVAGGAIVALALPVFVLADWRLGGWALGAGLWVASRVLDAIFSRAGIGEPTLRGSGVVAFGMMGRGILLALVAVAVAVIDPSLAVAGALVYAAAYTFEFALSLTLYFQGEARR